MFEKRRIVSLVRDAQRVKRLVSTLKAIRPAHRQGRIGNGFPSNSFFSFEEGTFGHQ